MERTSRRKFLENALLGGAIALGAEHTGKMIVKKFVLDRNSEFRKHAELMENLRLIEVEPEQLERLLLTAEKGPEESQTTFQVKKGLIAINKFGEDITIEITDFANPGTEENPHEEHSNPPKVNKV